MVTILDKNMTSDFSLESILYSKKKEGLLKIAKCLDFWISSNVTKAKVASRLAAAMLESPIDIVTRLSKTELLLLEEFLTGGPNAYIEKKARKTDYILQKLGLVVTYDDYANNKWHMLMPNEVREALKEDAEPYIALAKEGKKGPSAKELRMISLFSDLLGHNNFSIIGNTVINYHVPSTNDNTADKPFEANSE